MIFHNVVTDNGLARILLYKWCDCQTLGFVWNMWKRKEMKESFKKKTLPGFGLERKWEKK